MKKSIFSILALVSFAALSVVSARGARGVPRPDLVGKLWHQLPPTRYPGFTLPMPWKTKKAYELKFFQPDFGKHIVTIVELAGSEDQNEALIVSAVDFSALNEGEVPAHDCFYRGVPACDGRLCDGLLIGVINQSVPSKDGTYVPTEVWRITPKKLKFEKVRAKNVVCKPQSYER